MSYGNESKLIDNEASERRTFHPIKCERLSGDIFLTRSLSLLEFFPSICTTFFSWIKSAHKSYCRRFWFIWISIQIWENEVMFYSFFPTFETFQESLERYLLLSFHFLLLLLTFFSKVHRFLLLPPNHKKLAIDIYIQSLCEWKKRTKNCSTLTDRVQCLPELESRSPFRSLFFSLYSYFSL